MNLMLYLFIKKVIQLTVVVIKEYHQYKLHTELYPTFFCQFQKKLWGIMIVDFSLMNTLLIRYFVFIKY